MPGPANALNINEEGLVYFNGTNDFSGIPGVTAGFVLTDGGAGMPGSYQAIQTPPLPITPVDFAASPYTVLAADRYLEVDASGGAISIVLQAARATGVPLIIKDAAGQASTNNITLSIASGPALIDGSATFVMSTDYESIAVIFDGTNYEIYAAYNTGGGAGTYYSITPYIVGPDAHSEFATIQAAITQAVSDGASDSVPKNIFVKPGTYTETLTGNAGIRIIGLCPGQSNSAGSNPYNLSVIWNGELTWASGKMVMENIRIPYSGSGTAITLPANSTFSAIRCQLQGGSGIYFGTSGNNAFVEMDTCNANVTALFDSANDNVGLSAQGGYITGTVSGSGTGIGFNLDYCYTNAQFIGAAGGGTVFDVEVNNCYIYSANLVDGSAATSPGNTVNIRNCAINGSSALILLNKGSVFLRGVNGITQSVVNSSYNTGSNVSLYNCSIQESGTSTLGDSCSLNLYNSDGLNTPTLGSGAAINYYNSLGTPNSGNNSNTIINSTTISTSATDGFLHLPACAGTPSGTPTLFGDAIPAIVDSTNNKVYIYASGAWRDISGGGGGGIGGTNYIYVQANGTADANFVDLAAAYATAVADTPSSTNVWTIVAGPGYYNDVANTGLQMNTSYVNLVSLTGNKDVIISNSAMGGVPCIELTADNVFIRGILADPNCPIYTGATLANIRIENCQSMYYNSFAGATADFPAYGAAGTFVDCIAGDGSFGGTGNGAASCSASGTFIRCKGGSYCFAGNGGGSPSTATASGTFIDCEAASTAFGSEGSSGGSCSGTFIRCKLTGSMGSASGFGTGNCVVTSTAVFQDCVANGNGAFGVGGVSCDGTFINCRGLDSCFGSSNGTGNTCAGTFINCVGQDYCFGAQTTASGTFENCVARDWGFGSVPNGSADGDPSGTFINCIARDYSYGVVGGGGSTGGCSGTFRNCVARDTSFGAFGATASGNFFNCIAGSSSFGDSTFSGFASYCQSGSGSFGASTLTGVLNFCKTSGSFNTVSGGGRTVYCIDGSNATNNQ